MQIGLVGLGKMGGNMRERLRRGGVEVTGYDPNPAVTDAPDLAGLVAALPVPRVVWVMVPSGPITDQVIADLGGVLAAGDLVIDGGNSRFTDDALHAAQLAEKGIRFVDCGVSGGIWGDANSWPAPMQTAAAYRATLAVGFSPWPSSAAACGLL